VLLLLAVCEIGALATLLLRVRTQNLDPLLAAPTDRRRQTVKHATRRRQHQT
jgi:hypothetical protein